MSGRSRIVVLKIGTSTLLESDGDAMQLSMPAMEGIVDCAGELRAMGYSPVLVSSGAIGTGCSRLHLDRRPQSLDMKRALAALGQIRLIRAYDGMFERRCNGAMTAQVLLTRRDLLLDRESFLMTRRYLLELTSRGIVPIINENDVVAKVDLAFGDNDSLSAYIAACVQAEWVFLLTDVFQVYTDNPRTNPDAVPLRLIEDLTTLEISTAGDSTWGTGGMATKLTAASIATRAGIHVGITHGRHLSNVIKTLRGEEDAASTVIRACARPIPLEDELPGEEEAHARAGENEDRLSSVQADILPPSPKLGAPSVAMPPIDTLPL